MAFNDLFRTANRTAMRAVGAPAQITDVSEAEVTEVMAVIDRDIEVLDESGQIVGRTHTVGIVRDSIAFVPVRNDLVVADSITYTLGKRLEDDGFSYLFEATT
jgi:hypothetical protein